jgi:Tol biopolymer transport system component
VKLARGSDFALITTSESSLQVNNKSFPQSRGYRIPIATNEKIQRLCDTRPGLRWMLTSDAKRILANEYDSEKLAEGSLDRKYWTKDLTKTTETKSEFPAGFLPIDISSDDTRIIGYHSVGNEYRTSLVTVKDGKHTATEIPNENLYPHGISPDGRLIFASDNSKTDNSKARMVIYNLETKSKTLIRQPEELQTVSAYTFGADGKRIAFVGYKTEQLEDQSLRQSYRIYVCNTDGTGLKKIYETTENERITDIDWR